MHWSETSNWILALFVSTLVILKLSYDSIISGAEQGTDHECVPVG